MMSIMRKSKQRPTIHDSQEYLPARNKIDEKSHGDCVLPYFCSVPRTLIAIILLLSLSYQLFVKLGVVVWFEYNRDYISKNLCENRNMPEKKCCGKCYLRKQLKKADDGTTPSSGKTIPSKWNMGEVLVYVVPQPISVPLLFSDAHFKIPVMNDRYLHSTPLADVFRPPLFA